MTELLCYDLTNILVGRMSVYFTLTGMSGSRFLLPRKSYVKSWDPWDPWVSGNAGPLPSREVGRGETGKGGQQRLPK